MAEPVASLGVKKRGTKRGHAVSNEERERKRRERKIRNRQSAERSRQRKQQFYKDLEVEVISLRAENATLKTQKGLDALMKENEELKREVKRLKLALSDRDSLSGSDATPPFLEENELMTCLDGIIPDIDDSILSMPVEPLSEPALFITTEKVFVLFSIRTLIDADVEVEMEKFKFSLQKESRHPHGHSFRFVLVLSRKNIIFFKFTSLEGPGRAQTRISSKHFDCGETRNWRS